MNQRIKNIIPVFWIMGMCYLSQTYVTNEIYVWIGIAVVVTILLEYLPTEF